MAQQVINKRKDLFQAMIILLSKRDIVVFTNYFSGPELASQSKVVCTDINPQAVICTEMNANAVLGANKHMIQPIHADLFPPSNDKYDLIVSNPPFKPVENIRTPFELCKCLRYQI